MKDKFYISLTGGLGNQLFQLAAGLYIAGNNSLILDASLGRPRSTFSKPDIELFTIPPNVVVRHGDASWFSKKVSGYLLRSGIETNRLENRNWFRESSHFLGSLCLSLHQRSKVGVHVARNIGYSPIESYSKLMLIGYFQSYIYSEMTSVYEALMSLRPERESQKLNDYVYQARREKPIYLHVRLTDYLNEKKFGLPKSEYYAKALDNIQGSNRRIWVFSDDIVRAKSLLPIRYSSNYFFLNDEGMTSAEVLQLFRYGRDYVIANSTFSWWGARLRYDDSGRVYAPKPWFSNMQEPDSLIPPDWIRLNA